MLFQPLPQIRVPGEVQGGQVVPREEEEEVQEVQGVRGDLLPKEGQGEEDQGALGLPLGRLREAQGPRLAGARQTEDLGGEGQVGQVEQEGQAEAHWEAQLRALTQVQVLVQVQMQPLPAPLPPRGAIQLLP